MAKYTSRKERRERLYGKPGRKPIVKGGVKLYWSETLKKYVSVPEENMNIDLIDKYLGEAKSQYYKEFVKYAKEIVDNLAKKMNLSPKTFKENCRQIQYRVITIMGVMSQGKNSLNYKNVKKFVPKKYNEILFTNADGNTYDSEWMSMTDAKQFTVARDAMMQYSKEKMDNILKRSDLVK